MIIVGYLDNIKRGYETCLLHAEAMLGLADDANATAHGFLTLIIGGLIYALAMLVISIVMMGPLGALMGVVGAIMMPLAVIVGFFICYSIYHLLAKLFGGQATGTQFFRVIANASVIMWPVYLLMLVPVLGQLVNLAVSIWFIVVLVFIVKTVHKLSTGKSIAVVLIPIAVLVLLVLVLIGVLAYFGVLSPPETLLPPG